MADRRRRGNVIRFERPAPGASAEERAQKYADALLNAEVALNAFSDELARATEEILVLRNMIERDREDARHYRERREQERQAEVLRREADKVRFEHIEAMLETVLRRLTIDMHDLPPPMRDKMPTADDLLEAAERGAERAIERKTPATAFAVPGFSPWQAPAAPVGITSERAKELVENVNTKNERDELREREKTRGDTYRNILIGVAIFVGGPAVMWALWQLVTLAARTGGHTP